jgi:hypothetical protein
MPSDASPSGKTLKAGFSFFYRAKYCDELVMNSLFRSPFVLGGFSGRSSYPKLGWVQKQLEQSAQLLQFAAGWISVARRGPSYFVRAKKNLTIIFSIAYEGGRVARVRLTLTLLTPPPACIRGNFLCCFS